MFFKQLEVVGFKSFSDHHKLTFDPGITIVVGPNGCGKSNISDAIRWVLGEQSAKILRGQRMDDFIFSGSETRKAAGYAKATLTFEVDEGKIKTPFGEFKEIAVTRALYRTGESEYSINKIACRLKDIADVFMDTGINTRSISIISQGHVEALINAKPEDRRILIEEAAGVVKYKARKHEAVLKLKNSKENITRLYDIVDEVRKSVNRLRGQAGKATKAKKYRDEIARQWENELCLRYNAALNDFHGVDKKKQEFEDQRLKLEVDFQKAASMVEQQRQQVSETEDSYYKSTETLAEKKQIIESCNNRMKLNEERVELIKRTIEENRQKIEDLNASNEEIRKETEAKGKRFGDLKEKLDAENAIKAQLEEQITVQEGRLRESQSEVEKKEKEFFAFIHQISQISNDISSLDKVIFFKKERAQKLEQELEGLKEEKNKGIELLEQVQSELAVKEEEKRILEGETSVARDEMVREEESLLKHNEKLAATDNELIRLNTRFHTLQSIVREHGDLPGEQKKTLEHFNDELEAGKISLFIDSVKVQDGYELALENYLGDKLHSILIHDEETFGKVLNYHEENQMLGNYFCTYHVEKTTSVTPAKKTYIPFTQLVTANDSKIKDFLLNLFNGVFYVESLKESANSVLIDKNGKAHVSANGFILDESGAFESRAQLEESESLFLRRKELEDLGEKIKSLETTQEQEKAESETLKKKVEDRRFELEELREREKHLLEFINRESSNLENLIREKDRLLRHEETLQFEIQQIGEEEAINVKRKAELAIELDESGKRKEEMEVGFQKQKESIRSEQETLNEIKDEFNHKRVEVNSLEGSIQLCQVEIDNNEKEIQKNSNEVKNLRESIKKRSEEADALQKENDDVAIELSGHLEELNFMQEEELAVKNGLEEVREQLRKQQEAENDVNKSLKELNHQMESIIVHQSEAKSKVIHLEGQVIEKTDKTPEDIKLLDVEENLEDIVAKRSDTERRLGTLGEINYAAIEEFEEENKRLDFLNQQIADLEEAINSIEDTIAKIDKSSKNMFFETYNKVNENFKRLFIELFEGGEAYLELSQPDNILETGIHIFCRPPGKKLQNLTLLSSGEKAMTTIALLFSVFMERPAPFCFLDEVDAPLDELNIHRFIDLIKRFSDKTQFVLISHNQRTISFADVLYGVTMEEQGVSKVVSVNVSGMGVGR